MTDRVIEFSEDKIREYPGNIDSYLQEQTTEVEVVKKEKEKKVDKYKIKKKIESQLRIANKESKAIENEIEIIESKIETFNQMISPENIESSDSEINYDDYNKLNEMLTNLLDKWEVIQKNITDLLDKKNKMTH